MGCPYKPLKEWQNILAGKDPVFILANGPSLSENNLSLLDDHLTIGINRILGIYQPTILFFQDSSILQQNREKIIGADSIKVVRKGVAVHNNRNDVLYFTLTLKKNPGFIMRRTPEHLEGIGGLNQTHGVAIQFAAAIGASSIVLLGVDCSYKNGKTDFYGQNKYHRKNMREQCLELSQKVRDQCYVPIYNCGLVSCWRQRKIEDVLTELSPIKRGKEYFKDLFRKGSISV